MCLFQFLPLYVVASLFFCLFPYFSFFFLDGWRKEGERERIVKKNGKHGGKSNSVPNGTKINIVLGPIRTELVCCVEIEPLNELDFSQPETSETRSREGVGRERDMGASIFARTQPTQDLRGDTNTKARIQRTKRERGREREREREIDEIATH